MPLTEVIYPKNHGEAWNQLAEAACMHESRYGGGCDRIDSLRATGSERLNGKTFDEALKVVLQSAVTRTCTNCPIQRWGNNGKET